MECGYKPVSPKETRHFLIGPSGGGKPTFAAGIPRNLILDPERGAGGIPNARAVRVYIPTAQKLLTMIDKLESDAKAGKRPFDRVTFDTMDQIVEVMAPYLGVQVSTDSRTVSDIRYWGKEGAGYTRLTNACWDLVQRLECVGYAWTIIGHIREKDVKINDKTTTVVRPVLYPTLKQIVVRNCDIFACFHSQRETKPKFRMVQGRKVSAGTEEVNAYYMNAESMGTTIGAGEGKLRGVPGMSKKLVMPDPTNNEHGWDIFTEEYNKAVSSIKETVQ